MKNLHRLFKSSALIFVYTVFVFQSCTEVNKDISPKDKDPTLSNTPKVDPGITEWQGEVPELCKSVCLVAGQHMNVGSVNVSVVNNDLLVTYNILEDGIYLEEVHLDIFVSEAAFKAAKKISNGGAIPGKFEYQKSWDADDKVTTHTVKISAEYINEVTGGANCFYIAAHAALSNGETAWGGICNESDKGVTLVDALQFPGKNWSVYFKFCMDDCASPIDFTYAWEDLKNSGNDADYNDLVVKSDVLKSNNELKINFIATARGAAYNHAFKIKIPKMGITSIAGDDGVESDGSFYYITIFSSTKAALPPEGDTPYANTSPDDVTCDPTATAQIILGIDEKFSYDEAKPFEPFITVHPGSTKAYDLYIWEISGISTWTKDGKEYPNGIIIPKNWQWPLERQNIKGPYPDFSSITDGFNYNWSDNLADPSKVWSCAE